MASVDTYWNRAASFLDALKFLSDDLNAYSNPVGLLAVHASISLSDAIQCHLGQKPVKGDEHKRAVAALRRTCARRAGSVEGIRHFGWLLSQKHCFAYDDRRVGEDDVKTAIVHVERFFEWARREFPTLGREN